MRGRIASEIQALTALLIVELCAVFFAALLAAKGLPYSVDGR